MAQPSPFSNVPTTADIATQRKLALALQGQAIDTSPVGHWTQALARAVQGGVGGMNQSAAAAGEKSRQDALAQALAGSGTFGGLSEGDRAIMTQNPEIMQSVATKALGNKMDPNSGKTDAVRNYEYSLKNPGFAEFKRKAGEAPSSVREYEYYNLLDDKGKQAYIGVKRAQQWKDTGTEFVLPNAANPAGPVSAAIPKDVAGKERQEQIGQAQGKAAVDLPRIVDNASQALQTIEQIEKHPGTRYALGAGSLVTVPGTYQADAVELINQLQGKAFLEAFNSLKGGGQITEAEGKKATDAIARLARRQSREGFSDALKDLKGVIITGVERAKRNAAMGNRAPSPAKFKVPDGWKIEVE